MMVGLNSLSEHIVSAPSMSALKNRELQFELVHYVFLMCNAWFLFLHLLVFY